MIARTRRRLGIALALCAGALVFSMAESSARRSGVQPGSLSLWLGASGLGGGTAMTGRPLLPRTGYAISGAIALGDENWTWLALGFDWFNLGESMPDASLFLYRGYGGNSLFVGTGPRLNLASLGWQPLSKSRLDVIGGCGIAATEDAGTPLVSLLPFLRLESRLVTPISPSFAWSIGLPLELQKKATALTWTGGLSLALAWTPGLGGKK